MQLWEYFIKEFTPYEGSFGTETILNALGKNGWELIHIQHHNGGKQLFYFKRLIHQVENVWI